MKTKITTLAIIALTIMGCNDSKKSNSKIGEETSDTTQTTTDNKANNVTLEDTKWVITTLEGSDMSDREANGQIIYFTLDSKTNRVNGNSGCNTFMGTYTLEAGNRISFSQLGSTRMLCPDSKINESQILNVFETADNYTISNGKLSLNKAKRAPLAVFKKGEPDAPIVGKHWKLITLEGQDIKMVDNQEEAIYFTLNGTEQRASGFAGCNTFNGDFTLEEGNRIRFSKMAVTMKACPDVAVNESEFLKVFEMADNYTISDNLLSLNIGRRAPLAVFEAVDK